MIKLRFSFIVNNICLIAESLSCNITAESAVGQHENVEGIHEKSGMPGENCLHRNKVSFTVPCEQYT